MPLFSWTSSYLRQEYNGTIAVHANTVEEARTKARAHISAHRERSYDYGRRDPDLCAIQLDRDLACEPQVHMDGVLFLEG